MPLVNTTSVTAVLLLLYLSSFILLAILRIATGISIQRIGFSSLRHISYSPIEGLRIDLRGLGLSIHRPTFAQPTWISIVIEELKVTLDPEALEHKSAQKKDGNREDSQAHRTSRSREPAHVWKRLTKIKESIKRLHRQIHLLRMFDINALNTSAEIVGVGYVHVSSFTAAVYTRKKLLDRGRLFRHKKDPLGDQKPAEWVFTVRSILMGVGGRDPIEVLDAMTINVHGLLYKDREGLRDTSIAIKGGRLYVPVDELIHFSKRSKKLAKPSGQVEILSPIDEISFEDFAEELESPGSREAAIVQTVAESKEFLRSTLQSVQEVQVGMSFVRISKEIESLRQANLPLIANMVIHEIGIDLHRLEQHSPSHRMYFQRDDIAHQALLAALSISVSLDEDDARQNRIMYIPMATTTIRTTLPAKTMNFTQDRDVAERNTNILFANLVVTSPSLDLAPQHLIKLLAVARSRESSQHDAPHNRHRLISRLLPKASIKFSVQEPVLRFVLPVANPAHAGHGEYDMIISSISSISLDVESSHSAGGEMLYSLGSSLRIMSHQLYYQASTGTRHNLIITEALELKVELTASTEVSVILNGNLRTFSVLMVRDEVSKALYNIVKHFTKHSPEGKVLVQKPPRIAFLRKLPAWLIEANFEGSGCSFEAAGVDASVSSQTRGVALELESWSAQYTSSKSEMARKPKGRKASTSVRYDEHFSSTKSVSSPAPHSRHRHSEPTDGRRLACHVKGFEGFIIESADAWEPSPFLSVPRLEVAFSTSRDQQGPMFHIHSAIRAIYLEFSLYRYYSIGVGSFVVKEAFLGPVPLQREAARHPGPTHTSNAFEKAPVPLDAELFAIDVKAHYVQVKAQMPHDPPVMLQIYELSGGRHRWSPPFLRAELARMHAEAAHLKRVWARVVSISGLRVDLRHTKKKTSHGAVDEKTIDVATDFIRFAVPHGLEMYKVFDNFINTSKAMAQLHHRFKTRSNEYVLSKHPEAAKKIPRVSVRTKALCFELEDDPFEWKLGVIYHVGLVEQKQRLARIDAYRLKVKRMNEERRPRSASRLRAHSAHSSRRGSPNGSLDHRHRRSHSIDTTPRKRSTSRGRRGRGPRQMRYDRDGVCALTSDANIEADEAWLRLQEHSSRSWKRRIDFMLRLQNNAVKSVRQMFSGADEPPHDDHETETILGIPNRPGLMTLIISDLHLIVDKPSFPDADLPKFIHEIGKGMPHDMQYGLLVPLNLSLDMGEARVFLRDYPLNLLHIPAIRPGQQARLPSWSLRSDFVIAEEFRDENSTRHIKVEIVPKGQHARSGKEIPAFAIDVRRTVAPVKTYSKPVIDINTSLPTTISWGTSYQPVIQDMMMIIESFTKPEIDPSERVGFWDKIRLSFHSRLVVNWKGDGDLQLRLKGTRDPYVVTGYGAGFVMCWRNDVQWLIHQVDDPRQFMTVKSGEFVLAVPDYSHEARKSSEQQRVSDSDSVSSVTSTAKNAALFKKVIMKLSGNVQWTAGLVFERDIADGMRSSEFQPHYDVVLKNPLFLHDADLDNYDAFRGFRSQHVHMSIAVAAPFDKNWVGAEVSPSESYNSVHLSPKFFSHFFNWWSTFSGVMSLPVRQGSLWRPPGKTSKKFGRHLATIKYNLLLSPLFLSHVYKHKDAEDYSADLVSATGLKIKIDSFMLDLHQRREYFNTMAKGRAKHMRTSGMKINKTELDFVRADLRAVAALIAGTTAEELAKASDEKLASLGEVPENLDLSQFTIPDQDLSWIDMDDFVELDWVLPAESNPETKILPLAFTPRFTYFRQTDHGGAIQGDASRTSPFGEEDTHFCVMGHDNDPRKVQMDLIETRLHDLEDRLQTHVRIMNEHEVLLVREGDQNRAVRDKHDLLVAQQKELESKRRFLQHGLRRLMGHANSTDAQQPENSPQTNGAKSIAESDGQNSGAHMEMEGLYSAPHDEFASDFNNRFIIHNVQLKWSNSLRNIILRYSHQVSQRRGFVYYMSRRAVKFILDIVDEQAKAKEQRRKQEKRQQHIPVPPTPSIISPSEEKDEDSVIEDRIKQLLNDAKRFVHAPDHEEAESVESPVDGDTNLEKRVSTADPGEKIADNFQAMNSYHVRLIAPQIQLQSEKNTKAIVLISAKGMQLKVVSIMDKERMSDDVSGLVQRRFALDMDGAQFFVATQKTLARYLHLYSGNKYGNSPGSSWPPWVSLEAMFDFHLEPFGFQRVIQKTSASLRYEKYNPLRLKYNEEVESTENEEANDSVRRENRIDQLWVDFPRIRVRCDSTQYYAMYIIVLDLLLYSEPLEKTRSERLEKIMLASDFSDLRGAPEMAESLQERIQQLEDIKLHFQINAKYLDKHGWQDRINLEKDLASCEDELFFIMKAINTSQQKAEDRKTSQTSGLLRWYLSASEVVWHLMRDKDEPLLEFQLGNAAYERIDNTDGSNHNALEVEHIRGWNLLNNALYPEIIGPYNEASDKDRRPSVMDLQKMVQVHWYMLEAIAGIPVLEHFQVTVFPLKVQLERELGKKLFEYIFPGTGSDAFDDSNFSPLMVKNMEPTSAEDDQEFVEAHSALMSEQGPQGSDAEKLREPSPAAVARRLKPTYGLDYDEKHRKESLHPKNKGLGISNEHHSKFFKHFNSSNARSVLKEPTRKGSSGSLRSSKKHDMSTTSLVALGSEAGEKKRFNLGSGSKKEKEKKDKAANDDLSQMISRASNYMTLAHVRLNSFVVCLSYKGKSDRNFEDLHDFVFRMPTLEYRNKTWSNLDLALRLKKDVIRALISHTGAIIGNKFSHHRPSKKQVERLKEIAHNSTIPNSDISLAAGQLSGTSETTSLYSFSQDGKDDDLEGSGISFQSPPGTNGHTGRNGTFHGPSPLLRSGSWSSGINLPGSGGSAGGALAAPPRSVPGTAVSSGTLGSGTGSGGLFSSSSSLFSQRRPNSAHPTSVPTSSPNVPTLSAPVPPSSSHGPTRSLLKDTIGRHFSGETVKAKVHFGGLSLIKSESHKEKDREKEHARERSESQSSHMTANNSKLSGDTALSSDDVFGGPIGTNNGNTSSKPSLAGALAGMGGDESEKTTANNNLSVIANQPANNSETDINRRKSVLTLGKKVLNRLS
ncbi:Protein SABRE [Cladophialophora chaetospira]|uniref:Protein SABRE n=1 Tax=Cladophialophora chaetospira TaxID=386627 RepID=A0AA39CM28_9EURO|nr:Protein SABRE [Cladophialophora chaetospira]